MKTTNRKMFVAVGLAAAIGMVTSVNASILLNGSGASPVPAPVYIAAADYSGNPTAAQIATAAGIAEAALGGQLYKFTPSTSAEDGTLASSYSSTHTAAGSPNSPNYETLTITYGGTPLPKAGATAFVVKDGTAGAYVWNLTGLWNGTDTIQIVNDFLIKPGTGPGSGQLQNISHAAFYGASIPNPGAAVPEPTTVVAGLLLLLPLGVSTFRIVRKKRAA